MIFSRQEKNAEAIDAYREAVVVLHEVYGEDHRASWSAKMNLANLLVDAEEALTLHEAHVAWAVAEEGELGRKTILAKLNMAVTLSNLRDEKSLLRALSIGEELLSVVSDDEPIRVNIYSFIAQAAHSLGQFEKAAEVYAAADQLVIGQPKIADHVRNFVKMKLSYALWEVGKRRESLKVANAALLLYRESALQPEATAEHAAWIAKHEKLVE